MAVKPGALIWDYIVFIVFVVATTFLPLWSRGKSPTTKKDYVFASGGTIGVCAMILSIARGTLGVRSFLGFPSELFYRGSAMWETLYGMLGAFPIVCFIFVPIYYSLGITSVYQYLDMRFKSRAVRCLASATFIWRQILNLGVTVFTPCVALNTVVGFPYWASILGITAIGIIFTLMGGLKAAIKADVIQSLTMILISAAIITQGTIEAGGPKNVIESNIDDGRMQFFKFTWNPSTRVDTFSAIFGQLFMSLSVYGCQQTFMQRYVSMKSYSKLKQTLMLNIPVMGILFSLSWIVGMVIYAVYRTCDPMTLGYIKKMDEILPFYVENKFMFLPGVLGLFLGSLFNSALSFLVSNINSLATVTWEDFVSQAPAFKNVKDSQQVVIIKIIGVCYAIMIAGISFAVGLLSGVVESSLLVTSATSGPLLGVFLLAMMCPSANKWGAIAGVVVSHFVCTWMAIGHLLYGMQDPELLPVSIEGCTNDTFGKGITKTLRQWPQSQLPIEINHNSSDASHWLTIPSQFRLEEAAASPSISPFYAITYMYYAVIGTFVCIIVGIIVSAIFPLEDNIYDENLLCPIILKLSKKLPGKPRKYLNSEKRGSTKEGTTVVVNTVEIVSNYGKKGGFVEVDLSKSEDTLQSNVDSLTFSNRNKGNFFNGANISKSTTNEYVNNANPDNKGKLENGTRSETNETFKNSSPLQNHSLKNLNANGACHSEDVASPKTQEMFSNKNASDTETNKINLYPDNSLQSVNGEVPGKSNVALNTAENKTSRALDEIRNTLQSAVGIVTKDEKDTRQENKDAENSTSNSRLFENYDSSTRNDFKGDRRNYEDKEVTRF